MALGTPLTMDGGQARMSWISRMIVRYITPSYRGNGSTLAEHLQNLRLSPPICAASGIANLKDSGLAIPCFMTLVQSAAPAPPFCRDPCVQESAAGEQGVETAVAKFAQPCESIFSANLLAAGIPAVEDLRNSSCRPRSQAHGVSCPRRAAAP